MSYIFGHQCIDHGQYVSGVVSNTAAAAALSSSRHALHDLLERLAPAVRFRNRPSRRQSTATFRSRDPFSVVCSRRCPSFSLIPYLRARERRWMTQVCIPWLLWQPFHLVWGTRH
ncbi:hypothetical protein M378DRAFT_950152 [Amanita muscaria Koide BX008]|uniref:Uncharacterized protein n=1 Tax=Amanita muscaria (strain Koide BX008) TaxID=946122 RepID=A0A0C2WVC1_AMAMK|nr:hypothetical protein M378DRAFT_950152 [Amanita muscaria Koide BX008]